VFRRLNYAVLPSTEVVGAKAKPGANGEDTLTGAVPQAAPVDQFFHLEGNSMAANKAPGFKKEELGEKGDIFQFQNRGYWGYHEGEEGDAEGEVGHGAGMGCGAGG